MRRLDQRLREVNISGERIMLVDTEIPDDGPQELREGLARRAIVNAGGVCPCGAKFLMPSRATRRAAQRRGEIISITVEHEVGCPAATEFLVQSARRWTGEAS